MATKATPAKAAAPAAKKPSAKAPAKPAAKAAAPAKGGAPAPAPAKPAVTNVTVKHLSAGLAERHGMEKKQAETVVTNVFEALVGHIKAGDRVRIGGLGILEVKDRPARMGRNPATGEAIQIKASKKIAFRPAKELKEGV